MTDLPLGVLATLAGPREPWMDAALCTQVDPEAFFPFETDQYPATAKRTCDACPVTTECLTYGMDDDFGVFGGLTPRERRTIRRRNRTSSTRSYLGRAVS